MVWKRKQSSCLDNLSGLAAFHSAVQIVLVILGLSSSSTGAGGIVVAVLVLACVVVAMAAAAFVDGRINASNKAENKERWPVAADQAAGLEMNPMQSSAGPDAHGIQLSDLT
jgi:hypothetical protein